MVDWASSDRSVGNGFMRLGLVGVLLVLVGCVSQPKFDDDPEFRAILDDIHLSSAEMEYERRNREIAAIRRLDVVRHRDGKGYLVTADLREAPVSTVVDHILTASNQPFSLSKVRLGGNATVRFENLPLVEALNLIVEAQSISVASVNGILVFRSGGSIAPAAPDDSDDSAGDQLTNEGVALTHISSGDAISLLEGVFPAGNDIEGAVSITYGSMPELNEVYLSGPRDDVLAAVAVLNRADREVPHVLIEVLVVEFDVVATAALGVDLAEGAVGNWSGIDSNNSASESNLILSFLHGANNPAQLTLMIDYLVGHQMAQVLSRPFLTARSGQEANVEIVDDQYLAVATSSDGVDFVTEADVSAGVRLEIIPTVQSGDMIRLEMVVEDSEFEPVRGNALTQRTRKTAKTSVNVPDGQPVVIGGLNQKRTAISDSGIPWLRGVPVLKLLAAKRGAIDATKEIVVYLIPRIWNPNESPPVTSFDGLRPSNDHLTPYERLR